MAKPDKHRPCAWAAAGTRYQVPALRCGAVGRRADHVRNQGDVVARQQIWQDGGRERAIRVVNLMEVVHIVTLATPDPAFLRP